MLAMFLICILIGTASPARAASSTVLIGRWAVDAGSSGADDGRVELELAYNSPSGSHGGLDDSQWSERIARGTLGVTGERLRAPIGPIRFTVARDAGTFACTGSAGGGSGAGQFTYTPAAAFGDAMAARGIARPTPNQSIQLAMDDMTVAFVDIYVRPGNPHPAIDDLVRLAQHDVGPSYADELASVGYKITSIDELVRLRDHGVSVRFIRDLRSLGYANLSIDELQRFVDHGVRARLIADLPPTAITTFRPTIL